LCKETVCPKRLSVLYRELLDCVRWCGNGMQIQKLSKAGISQFRDARTGSGQHTRARTRSGIIQNEHPSNK